MSTADGASKNSPLIAVVGMACRLPGAANPAELWSRLETATDCIGEIPADRWDVGAFFHPDPNRPGKMYTRAGGFISNIDKFDAAFFGISPREARRIDPQQRILLELAWEALEDAGIIPERLAGSQTGVFIGISASDYGNLQRDEPDSVDAYVMSGSALGNAANRISYVFDFHGPSFAADTACSSSLVAVHEACVSLRNGESSAAVVGGINLILAPSSTVGFSKAHMLSPTGRCRPFDAGADGYVRSEGGVVFVLKRLADALSDGDTVHAVIAGTGVNSDGRTSGLAMPNQAAQEALLREVYREAHIDPREVTYIEAHGTGTGVGDPIECGAIGAVLGKARDRENPCLIGSIKSNIGHLEPASGVAGLLKLILAMRHRALPPSLHFKTPNPRIGFDELNLSVVSGYKALGPGPLVMGVNSFGFGGTNAHVVLRGVEEPRKATHASSIGTTADSVSPLMISARSPEALSALASRYAAAVRADDSPGLSAIGRSAATRRTQHRFRLAVCGKTRQDVADRLEAFAATGEKNGIAEGKALTAPAKLALTFSGNGSQWFGMGRDLLADPLAAQWIERVDAELHPFIDWSVTEVLASASSGEINPYDRTEIAQPALFALQVAIFEWLRAHGVAADAVVGHSVGEVAAAYAAGALSLEDACRVIAQRSLAQAPTAGAGRMAAIGLSAQAAAAAIAPYGEGLTISAINSPNAVTVAGTRIAIEALGGELAASGAFFRALDLDYAFHSPAMDPIRDDLVDRLRGLTPKQGSVRFASTVTGGVIEGNRLDAEYWWNNIRKPVQFAAAIGQLISEGYNAFLEVGPHPVLEIYVRECLRTRETEGVSIATLRREGREREALWLALGRSYVAGVPIDFDALYPGSAVPVALPAYPWQRERYWYRADDEDPSKPAARRSHPLLRRRLPTIDPIWQSRLDLASLPWLADHVVHGACVFPGTGFIEMAAAAASTNPAAGLVEIEGLEIRRPLVLTASEEPAIEITLSSEDGSFRVSSGQAGKTEFTFAVGRVVSLPKSPSPTACPLEALRSRLTRRIDAADLYRRFAEHGLPYGPAFQGIAEAWAEGAEAIGRIVAPHSLEPDLPHYRVHPAVLDACIQVALAVVADGADTREHDALVPTRAERIRVHEGGPAVAWCHVEIVQRGSRSVVADYRIMGPAGEVILEIDGLRLSSVNLGGDTDVPAYHWTYREHSRAIGGVPSADLPNPQTLLPTGDVAPPAVRSHLGIEALERVAGAYAVSALSELAGAQKRVAPEELIASGRLAPEGKDHLIALLQTAEKSGHAVHQNDEWRLRNLEAMRPPLELWRETLRDHSAHLASLQLVARWGEEISAFPRGGATEIASAAEPSFDPSEQLYDSDPIFRDAREGVSHLARRLFATVPATRTLRVLEIGGATGWLTASMLNVAPRERIDFVFSDPDESAVSRADARFADASCVRCAALDLARDPGEQGFVGDHDVVVMGIVPGRARPAARELGFARSLLKPGGLLLLAEVPLRGYLELALGWPSLPPKPTASTWHGVLGDAGFLDISQPAAGIVVARSPDAPRTAEKPKADPTTWLILSQNPAEPLVARTVDAAVARGDRVVIVSEGPQFEQLDRDRFRVRAGDRDGYDLLFTSVNAQQPARLHIVHLRAAAGIEPADPIAFQRIGSLDLLTALQAMIAAGRDSSWRLTLVTSGAMAAQSGSADCRHPWQAPLWGILRTALTERPGLVGRLIDLDPDVPESNAADALSAELFHPDEEDEVLLRGGARLVPRLMPGLPTGLTLARESDSGFSLSFAPGSGSAARFSGIAVPEPAAGEVTVRVRAAGLNFRDVLQRTRLIPEEAFEGGFTGATLGMEFSGEIVSVGAGVDGLKPGESVFGFGRKAFSSHIVAPAAGLFEKPDAMSHEEAASLPVAAVTVYYSLNHVARLQRGERILIHGAAGGVGIAAVQYAQTVGAEVFATAGSAEKRNFLRRLGVRQIFDSRSLAFADEILEITRGEGIDVVLNSIAGEAVHKSLAILRPFGRFVELGKRDFYANSKLGLRPFSNNIQFSGVDVDRLLTDRPALAQQVFRELAPLMSNKAFSPVPHRVFPISRAAEAFRCMQHSRHIGKIVLSMGPQDRPTAIERRPEERLSVSRDATYLVTGGRNGFGLATAEWLVRSGARHVALIGRGVTTQGDAVARIEHLRAGGIAVREFTADVADEGRLASVLSDIRREMPPLRGVVHCAAVFRDAALGNVSEAEFYQVLRPKMAGAWNLHRLTLDDDLRFFVLYSSATTLFGNGGQASYVAANLYLEALAAYRHGLGLPALAVGWGAISDVGHLARNPKIARLLSDRLGVEPLSPEQALQRLGDVIQQDLSQIALAELGWSRLSQLSAVARSPKFAAVRDLAGGAGIGATADVEEFRAQLAAMPSEEAASTVEQQLIKHISSVLGIAAGKLSAERSLLELGMDSLMLVETQVALEKQFGVAIPTMELMGATTIGHLARRLLRHIGNEPAVSSSPVSADGTTAADGAPAAAEPAEPKFEEALGSILERELNLVRERAAGQSA